MYVYNNIYNRFVRFSNVYRTCFCPVKDVFILCELKVKTSEKKGNCKHKIYIICSFPCPSHSLSISNQQKIPNRSKKM